MTWRVIWNPHGSPFPSRHDFAYAEAAKYFEGILRELGHQHVSTHHLDATEQMEKR